MIIHGDSLIELAKLADNSVDLLCTDPPYGYSFMGKSWDKTLPDIGIFKECLRVLKPGAFAFVMSAPRSDVCARMMLLLEDAGFNIGFTPIYWTYASGFPKAQNMGKVVDKRNGVEREVVGRNPNSRENCDISNTLYESGTVGKTAHITKGSGPLEGSYGGFQPKPAVEVIVVAMKPISEKTYVDQALANGKGITWLDDARIPVAPDDRQEYGRDKELPHANTTNALGKFAKVEPYIRPDAGRFPANLLVSDDVLNDGRVYKQATRTYRAGTKASMLPGQTQNTYTEDKVVQGSEGSYSRFFSLDAWAKTLPFIAVPKASKGEKGKDCTHPTVKPLKLMSYLITLGSRPGDVVLDPFLGSGTTAIAAKNLGRECIGIEREEEYIRIAEARLAAVPNTLL